MNSVTSNKQVTVYLSKSEIHKAVSPVQCRHLGQQDAILSNHSTYLSASAQGPCPCCPSVTVFHVMNRLQQLFVATFYIWPC